MKDEGGETTEGREGSRGNGAKGGGKPPPLALSRPFFRSPHSALLPSPSLVFSIPSEITFDWQKKKVKKKISENKK